MSETPSRDKEKNHGADPGVGEKERRKEDKRLKKDKSKPLSKSDVEESVTTPKSRTDTTKSASVPASSHNSRHPSGLSESSSSQTQSLPVPMSEEKRDSKDEKKEKKKRKKAEKAGKENGRAEQNDSVLSVYTQSAISPPARSYSAILPPKGTPKR